MNEENVYAPVYPPQAVVTQLVNRDLRMTKLLSTDVEPKVLAAYIPAGSAIGWWVLTQMGADNPPVIMGTAHGDTTGVVRLSFAVKTDDWWASDFYNCVISTVGDKMEFDEYTLTMLPDNMCRITAGG